jgi:hypothetical protein
MNVDRPENAAVLSSLYVEQRPEWRESTSIWVVDGYPLNTHPDLCDHVQAINAAAGAKATFRYLYGNPALIAPNGIIVAFARGTHTFCVRLPEAECDAELVAIGEPNALTGEWTRLDPYGVRVPRPEGVPRLAAHVERALAAATR